MQNILTNIERQPDLKKMHERLRRAYRLMLTSRFLDEKQLRLLKQGKSFFQIGGSGHEAAQVAAALALRPGCDWAFPYYRDQSFVLAYGITIRELLLASLHRAGDPATGSRQMPCHWGNQSARIVTQSSPTGTQFLQAVGTALAVKKEKADEVVYVSSGEGATSEGEFFEAVNWAARELLPVVFFIQDNKYAISVPVALQTAGGSVFEAVRGFTGLHRMECDGTDFYQTFSSMESAVHLARTGKGPSLIAAHVVRLLPHSSSDDHKKYRSEEELEREKLRDPLPRFARSLLENGILEEQEDTDLKFEIKKEIESESDWAEKQSLPDPSTVGLHLYGIMHRMTSKAETPSTGTGSLVVMVDAINHALDEELDRNQKMVMFGEDIADKKGGVFTATKGLSTKYGANRVFNSPLAEASIVGVAIGMAMKGWKPVVEIQFGDYIWPAFMQIRDELATIRYRSNGTWSCPLVIRVPVGGYIHGGMYHSQSIESFFTHIPGIRIVYPSNAADAKGLLKTAIRGDDPVLFLEHKGLYRQGYAAAQEPPEDFLLPFGQAAVRKEGADATIVTYGYLVQQSLEAARILEIKGVSAEVIDLRTLNPLDEDTVYDSVRKTNRVLLVHEDTLTAGFGAEIAARIAEHCFEHLDAPIMRVAAMDIPVPYSPPLEDAMLPNKQNIITAVERLVRY
jgi:2-oxoisovalerate dehydrogenase E1 component